jgi:hypothetical protein
MFVVDPPATELLYRLQGIRCRILKEESEVVVGMLSSSSLELQGFRIRNSSVMKLFGFWFISYSSKIRVDAGGPSAALVWIFHLAPGEIRGLLER